MLGDKNRQGTRARARRENVEENVDCRNVVEHIHHALMINSSEKYMLARAEGNSRTRKLDKLLINHDYSWSTFWSRAQADCEMPIEPSQAFGCHGAVGKGHFQLARCSVKTRSSTSARGPKKVDEHWHGDAGGKQQSKAENEHNTGKCW